MPSPVQSPALLTDLYQLTMAAGYFELGRQDEEAVFNLFFRRAPFASGFTVAAGLEPVVDLLRNFRFGADDIDFLRSITGNDNTPLFGDAFLSYLAQMELSVDVDAIPEGTLVFPHQPLVRVRGPIAQCQLLETALLNLVNFQTLIATKAARVVLAARGDAVLEFGLRRAQGVDGALAASRAAYIGGCTATSNVLAGKLYGIPVRGTHAHSWVMSFEDEHTSFEAYAHAMPNNCVFLVDTYDTLQGVRHAISVGQRLREQGKEMVGIRLDSGDLAWLSGEARKLLDAAGFDQANIVASGDLDEHLIESLKYQGAAIAVWGVGTRLVTAHDQPALGGVYKLAALRGQDGRWQHRIKLSEDSIKVSTPGQLQVRRFVEGDRFVADAIYDVEAGIPNDDVEIVDPADPLRRRKVEDPRHFEDLLVPVARGGALRYTPPDLDGVRARTQAQLASLDETRKRLSNAHRYPAGLEVNLFNARERMIEAARRSTVGD